MDYSTIDWDRFSGPSFGVQGEYEMSVAVGPSEIRVLLNYVTEHFNTNLHVATFTCDGWEKPVLPLKHLKRFKAAYVQVEEFLAEQLKELTP